MSNIKSNELWSDEIKNRSSAQRYPPDWERRKEYIREKYKYTCQNCGINLENDLEFLDVHHTYSMPDEPHHLDSLKLLCCLCHSQLPSQGLKHEFMVVQARVKDFVNKYDEYLKSHNPYRKKYDSAYDMMGNLLGYSYVIEMMTKNLYPVDKKIEGKAYKIVGKFQALTKKAILINYQNRMVWLPLRYIGVDLDDLLKDKMLEIEVPEWLYKKEFNNG